MSTKKVLVIDDESFIRDLVSDFLDLKNIQCDEAENAKRALEKFSKNRYSLVLLDVNLGKSSAAEVIIELKKIRTDVPILLLTGDPNYSPDYSGQIGADGIIYKPFQVDPFIENVMKFLEI